MCWDPTLLDFMIWSRADLKFESDLPYEILNEKVWPWSYSENQYLNVAETMRKAMTYNPHLKVFVGEWIL